MGVPLALRDQVSQLLTIANVGVQNMLRSEKADLARYARGYLA